MALQYDIVMGNLKFFILLCCATVAWSLPSRVDSTTDAGPANRNPSEAVTLIVQEGYPIQVHKVTTSDGYILEMHRIPFGRSDNMNAEVRPTVFLMHGLMMMSSGYIALGSENSIAYSLADAGCDVWIGNARGNSKSRQHVSLDPDDDEEKLQFFDFTWDEIGVIDVATMIDYVLQQTGRQKLHYIGHSQGGTTFLVLMSVRPEYNEKILSSHLWAPAGYKEHFPNPSLSNLAQSTDMIWSMASSIGFVEVSPSTIPSFNFMESNSKSDYCGADIKYREICREMQMDTILESLEVQPHMVGSGGAALKQFAHYGQNIRDKTFRRYDHGQERNIELYGTSEPPVYDLSLITSNVTIHYSLNDDLVSDKDAIAMAAQMPDTVSRQIARESFTHGDFIYAADAKEQLNDFVLDAILRDEQAYLDAINVEGPGGGGIGGENGTSLPEQQTGAASSISLSYLVKANLIVYSLYLLIKS